MKKKRIFIISFNHLPIDFWKEHIDLSMTEFWHFSSAKVALDNLTTMWPDIIIVDGYFAKTSYEFCLKNIVRRNVASKIYCVTPQENLRIEYFSIKNSIIYSKLTNQLVLEINDFIHLYDESKGMTQTA